MLVGLLLADVEMSTFFFQTARSRFQGRRGRRGGRGGRGRRIIILTIVPPFIIRHTGRRKLGILFRGTLGHRRQPGSKVGTLAPAAAAASTAAAAAPSTTTVADTTTAAAPR